MASTSCKYDLRKGDLFALSWARVRRVRRGSISLELLMCGGGVRSILLLLLLARFFLNFKFHMYIDFIVINMPNTHGKSSIVYFSRHRDIENNESIF